MATEQNSLQAIAGQKPVRVFIPILNTVERYRASCILETSSANDFKLMFKTGVLPVESIDTRESCLISVDMGGPNFSIEAKIKDIPNAQTLNMVVEKSINHEQLREFFRVDASTHVISSSFQPEFYPGSSEPWSLKGSTIDISGSGILAKFETQPPIDKQVRLAITLPAMEPETISVLASPVRSQKVSDNHFEVAYHFDDITTEDRDKIIGWCLVIQRRLLRLKVQVKDPAKL